MVKYHEIRMAMKTGDLVLFSGEGFVSNLIKLATRSKYSHVGMVLKINQFDFIALWESTTLNSAGDINGQYVKGVQISQLSARIDDFEGEVYWRPLQWPIGHDGLLKLAQLRQELKGRRYETSENELFKSVYDGILGNNEHDLSSVFCSELVAEAYQTVGLLSADRPSNEFTPADFGIISDLRNNSLKSAIRLK